MVISRWRGWYGLVLGGGIGLGGCSLLFSGSDYQGVGSPRDAGSDAADDARTPDARADAAATCEGAACTVKPSFVNDPNMALTGTADVVIAEDEQATWDLETGVLDHGGGCN